jgi:hypothetical protein
MTMFIENSKESTKNIRSNKQIKQGSKTQYNTQTQLCYYIFITNHPKVKI